MKSDDRIEQRMIDRAVNLFTKDHPTNRDGRFATANYSQALDEELGSRCDTTTCVGHLKKMDGVKRLSKSIWQRDPSTTFHAADDVGQMTVDLTATMTNILHLLDSGDLLSRRSLAFILGDQVLSDVGDDLGTFVDGLVEPDGDIAGLGFSSRDDLAELVDSLSYDGADDSYRVGIVITGFLASALYALEIDGMIVRMAAPAEHGPLFGLPGRDGIVIVSRAGDVCECGASIGKNGHCHDCGRALFGFHEIERVVLKYGDNCGCGGKVCERGYCDSCGAGLADAAAGLISEDWQEIYDALESQWQSIEDEDDEDTELAENWRRHIRAIMAKIGCDGQDMVVGDSSSAKKVD